MKTFILTAAISLSLSACATPIGSTDPAISMIAENAVYSTSSGSDRAVVTFDLRIQNRGEETAQLSCGFDLERDAGNGFINVSISACTGLPTAGRTIAAHSAETLRTSLELQASLIDENAKYRVVTAIAFGPAFAGGKGYKSSPFHLVRSQ